MPAKPASEIKIIEKVEVAEAKLAEGSNFKAIEAISTKTVNMQMFEDFIESSEFLGDNSLFVRYDFINDENEIFDADSNELIDEAEDLFSTPKEINSSKGRDFNLEYVNNFLALSEISLTPQQFSIFLSSLPNQIRALFLYQMDFVKKVKNAQAGDLITNIKTQALMNLNYFKLMQVEMFDGYETTNDGEPMLNKPKFKLLKKQDLDSLTQNTMCRIKSYNNNNLKINRDILSFPIECQYFFLQPSDFSSQETPERTQENKVKNITTQHFLANQYNLIGSTSNIVQQPFNTSTVSSTPQPQATQLTPTTPQAETTAATASPVQITTTTGGGY
jgi:hypothetical protein